MLHSLKTWYATWLVTFRICFWPLNPHKRVECVCKDRICACMLLAFMIPFNLLCNMTMFWKTWIMTFWPNPQGRGGGRGSLGAKHLLSCCCIWYATWPYFEKSWILASVPSLSPARGSDPGLQTKIPFGMFHIYCSSVCMKNFSKSMTTDLLRYLNFDLFFTPHKGSGGRGK